MENRDDIHPSNSTVWSPQDFLRLLQNRECEFGAWHSSKQSSNGKWRKSLQLRSPCSNPDVAWELLFKVAVDTLSRNGWVFWAHDLTNRTETREWNFSLPVHPEPKSRVQKNKVACEEGIMLSECQRNEKEATSGNLVPSLTFCYDRPPV